MSAAGSCRCFVVSAILCCGGATARECGTADAYFAHSLASQGTGGVESWEKDAKRGFIVKVYTVLAVQLAFTVASCGVAMYYDPVRDFMVGSG